MIDLNRPKGYDVIEIDDFEYNSETVLKHFDEIVTYFSKSKPSTADLNLFHGFIDMLWKKKHYDAALGAADHALEKYPLCVNLVEKKGEILLEKGENREAIEVLRQVLTKDPDRPHVLEAIGEAHFRLKEYAKAEDVLLQTLEMKSWSPAHLMSQFEIMEKLAKIYFELGDYSNALEFLEEIVTIQPRTSKWKLYFRVLKKLGQKTKLEEAKVTWEQIKKGRRYASRAAKYELQGKYELAVKNYRKAIEHNPYEPHYYFNVGHVLESLPEDEYEFQYEEATDYFIRACEMFPNNPFYSMTLVGNLTNTDQWERAFEMAAAAAERFPELMLPNLRYLSDMLGDEVRYIELLKHLIELDEQEELSELRSELAIILKERRDPESEKWFSAASKLYLKRTKADPYNWRHFFDYASCRLAVEDLNEARDYFIRAMELHGDFNQDVADRLSETFYHLGMYEDAKVLLEALVMLNPKDYEYLGRMGLCFMALEDYEKGFEAFNRSLLFNRNVPEYLYGAGVCAAKLHQTDDVINIIMDLLDMDPNFINIIEEEPAFREMDDNQRFFTLVQEFKKKILSKAGPGLLMSRRIR